MIRWRLAGLDFRGAARTLRRSPGFFLAGVLTLALAAGALNAILAVVSKVLLEPLPVRDQHEIVVAWKRDAASGFAHWPFTYPAIRAIESQLTTVAGTATVDYNGAYSLSIVEGDQGIVLTTGIISGSLMPLLGVEPILGRTIHPDDDVVGAPRVAVISETFWKTRYGGDPGVLGKRFGLYGERYEIVGVVRGGFGLPAGTVMWIAQKPFQPFVIDSEQYPLADLVVRLKPGVAIEQFRAELESVRTRTTSETVDAYRRHAVVVTPLHDLVVGEARPTLLLLTAGAALLVIVAAVNLGGLFLVRSGRFLHEIAIRSAIGGGALRSVGTLIAEFAVIVIVGIGLGVPVGWALLQLLAPMLPPELPIEGRVSLGPMPVLLATAACILAGLLASAAPAIALARADLLGPLRAGSRAATGWAMHPMRRVMVAAQLAVAVAIMAAAGLLLRTLERMHSIDAGFRSEGVLFVDLADSRQYDSTVARRRDEVDRITTALGAVPGVLAVSAVLSPPFVGNGGFYTKLVPDGMDAADAAKLPYANTEVVVPTLATTLGLRLIRGRFLEAADREGAPIAVVINETLARTLWPGEDPLGKVVRPPTPDATERATVVGVVRDTRYNELLHPAPMAYFAYRQLDWIPANYLIQTGSDREAVALVSQLRTAVQQAMPAMAVRRAMPLSQLLGQPLARPRLAAVLVTGFALVVLALSAIGVYSVMAAFVVQRTREIGVRMALGATDRRVRRLVFQQGMTLAVAGLVVGLLIAALAGRLLRGLLYEVTPADTLTYAAATVLVLGVASLAIIVPAVRASRLDPVTALKSD